MDLAPLRILMAIHLLSRIFSPYYTGQVIATVVATKSYASLASSIYIMIIISLVSPNLLTILYRPGYCDCGCDKIIRITGIFHLYHDHHLTCKPGKATCGRKKLANVYSVYIEASFGSAIAAGLRGGSFEYAYSRINRSLRHDLFTGLVRQDVAFFDAHKTGEITSRLAADCQTMSDTVAMNVNVFLRNAVMLMGSMIFMMTLSWRLSLITFILVPIIFVASKIFGSYYDVLSTMRTVRSFACEEVEGDRFYVKLTKTLNVTKTKAIAYIGFLWVSEVSIFHLLCCIHL
ncbi:unnamed protein product [Haemonchus placei]|uniref:ABC transmembrane type-1 domain-containing protein n=1 Tax=Haemonchus placei TaxID=6290 RepID=A0A0N4WTH0_HAEPC|nr:unnamed protein product [Haemonchus placei]